MIHICGRKVKVQTGGKSQTVNICTDKNIHGQYDYIIRFRPPALTEDELIHRKFKSIEDLVSCLKDEFFGTVEQLPAKQTYAAQSHTPPKNSPLQNIQTKRTISLKPSINSPSLADSSWEKKAMYSVDRAIDQFISEFIDFPYLHRVEHSVHCELFQNLMGQKLLNGRYPLENYLTQLIHKEWPEYKPRPKNGNRRGFFDLGILSPESIESSSLQEFKEGRIKPTFAIEVGLNYDLEKHLKEDSDKLSNSEISNGYLIHLTRPDYSDDFEAVEEYILSSSWKIAYARVTNSKSYYKFVNDSEIRTK
jgi:hypothetical protein